MSRPVRVRAGLVGIRGNLYYGKQEWKPRVRTVTEIIELEAERPLSSRGAADIASGAAASSMSSRGVAHVQRRIDSARAVRAREPPSGTRMKHSYVGVMLLQPTLHFFRGGTTPL